jgi:hypothetical protein
MAWNLTHRNDERFFSLASTQTKNKNQVSAQLRRASGFESQVWFLAGKSSLGKARVAGSADADFSAHCSA